ncbi:diuretic hormone class 2 isoform X1 [Maniola jurtina]|uniref:diuretic hormone class 2 isoform X1 n=1 Tax=Maniola jurtina TaxID=191418 RepID=UPI001E68C6D1|nr:diuretic hormone class 2 isoform X1 [Maniola jurtina]
MVRLSCLLTCCLLGALLLILPAAAYPRYANNYYREEGQYEPEEIVGMLNRLNDLIQMERKMESFKEEISRKLMPTNENEDISNEKRALDLGLSRGYSGAIQAKHLMGLAAANYAGGPGRRRRNAH